MKSYQLISIPWFLKETCDILNKPQPLVLNVFSRLYRLVNPDSRRIQLSRLLRKVHLPISLIQLSPPFNHIFHINLRVVLDVWKCWRETIVQNVISLALHDSYTQKLAVLLTIVVGEYVIP